MRRGDPEQVESASIAPAPPVSSSAVSQPPRPSSPHAVEAYWGLREAPFDNSPSPRFLYLAPEHETALARLLYAVVHRKGCATLTGGYGSGKTMLVRELFRRLPSERYDVAMVTNPRGNTVEFWRDVLWELGEETTEVVGPSLLRLVNDRLYRNFRGGRDTVVVIDEAQLIGDDAILEELRLLLNLQTDDRFLATILLVGSPALGARLERLDHIAQRIAVRCHLPQFGLSQTEAYITHRLRVAGLERKIFADHAIRLVVEWSGGVPRKINTLCDLALLIGYEEFAVAIDGNVMAKASRASRADALPGTLSPPTVSPNS